MLPNQSPYLLPFLVNLFGRNGEKSSKKNIFIFIFFGKENFFKILISPAKFTFFSQHFQKSSSQKGIQNTRFCYLNSSEYTFFSNRKVRMIFSYFYKFGYMYYNADFCNAQLILTITQKKSTQKSTLEST